jgi:PilZ domain
MLNEVKLWLLWLVGRSMTADEAGQFVQRLVHDKTHYSGPERRHSPRYPLVVPVSVMPLDEQFRPAGTLYRAVTRNISGSGVSILSHTRFQAKYLSLLLVNSSADYLEVIVHVARYNMVGPMHEYAGPFVAVPERARAKNRGPLALVPRQCSDPVAELQNSACELPADDLLLESLSATIETADAESQPV